jgi:TetR/AcrR family transcriptional regulator
MVDSSVHARSRRSDILAAAEKEFAAAGYSGARIERIAARAGVNKQLLFHYFDSKSGLFAAVLGAVLARHEPPDHAEDPASAIKHHLTALEVLARSTPGLVAILSAGGSDAAFPAEASTTAHAWMDRVRGRIAGAVEDGQRRGYYRDDIDPLQVARLGVAAALGVGAFGPGAGTGSVVTVLHEYCAWR